MTRAGRVVHHRWSRPRSGSLQQVTSEDVQRNGLVPYTGDGGLRTFKAMTYNGDELILGDGDVPPGAVAYVTGRKIRQKPFDFVPVQFYREP